MIHFFGRCSRFLDPALDTSPLKISSPISFTLNFHYHDHCRSSIAISNRNLLRLDVIVQSNMADYFFDLPLLWLNQ